jgi:hypothetical protein
LNGYISKQNYRIRSAEKPNALHENIPYLTNFDIRYTVSQKNCRRIFFEETNTKENYQNFDLMQCSAGRETKRNAVSNKMGLSAILRKK